MITVIRISLLGGECSWHCSLTPAKWNGPELKVEKIVGPSPTQWGRRKGGDQRSESGVRDVSSQINKQPFSWNQHSLWGILLLNLWSFTLWILSVIQWKCIYNTIIQTLERQLGPSRSLLSGREQTSKWYSWLWVKKKYKLWWKMWTRSTPLETGGAVEMLRHNWNDVLQIV